MAALKTLIEGLKSEIAEDEAKHAQDVGKFRLAPPEEIGPEEPNGD